MTNVLTFFSFRILVSKPSVEAGQISVGPFAFSDLTHDCTFLFFPWPSSGTPSRSRANLNMTDCNLRSGAFSQRFPRDNLSEHSLGASQISILLFTIRYWNKFSLFSFPIFDYFPDQTTGSLCSLRLWCNSIHLQPQGFNSEFCYLLQINPFFSFHILFSNLSVITNALFSSICFKLPYLRCTSFSLAIPSLHATFLSNDTLVQRLHATPALKKKDFQIRKSALRAEPIHYQKIKKPSHRLVSFSIGSETLSKQLLSRNGQQVDLRVPLPRVTSPSMFHSIAQNLAHPDTITIESTFYYRKILFLQRLYQHNSKVGPLSQTKIHYFQCKWKIIRVVIWRM